MRLNAGVVTSKLSESKKFYSELLGFGVTFENEFYLLMHTPNKQFELSFLLPHHPTQHEIFQQPYSGQGMYLTIEVDDVDALYTDLQNKGVVITVALRNEVWGDRHFTIVDPNGIAIDLVTYAPPQE